MQAGNKSLNLPPGNPYSEKMATTTSTSTENKMSDVREQTILRLGLECLVSKPQRRISWFTKAIICNILLHVVVFFAARYRQFYCSVSVLPLWLSTMCGHLPLFCCISANSGCHCCCSHLLLPMCSHLQHVSFCIHVYTVELLMKNCPLNWKKILKDGCILVKVFRRDDTDMYHMPRVTCGNAAASHSTDNTHCGLTKWWGSVIQR